MRKFTLLAAALAALCSACAPRSSMLITPDLATSCEGTAALDRPLVIANYNIKSGMWSSLEEVGDVLEGLNADVIALQEVDHKMKRTDSVDQSGTLAERLGMERVFVGAQDRDGGSYGIALLSKLPVARADRIDLPEAGGVEPRVAADVDVCTGGQALRVVSTHTDFTPWAADAQAKAIAAHIAGDDDVVVLGDFNATPEKAGVRSLIERPLFDALGMFTEGPTFEGQGRIDYILTDHTVTGARIVDVNASDHKPVFATIEVPALGNVKLARHP